MGAKADATANTDPVSRLGLEADQVVQEFGWDDDVDETLREAIEAVIGAEMLDESEQTVADVVVDWWRDGDGDLVDDLVDVSAALDDKGVIWLMTPRRGRDLHVDPADIQEAAQTAGLLSTSSVVVGEDWTATRLVPSGARRS